MATDPGAFSIDAFLCDSAAVAEGKLYVQGGGWNTITTKMFPFRQARIALALVVGVPYTATNQNHKLEIELVPPDPGVGESRQEPLAKALAEFNLGRPPMLLSGERQVVPFALNFDGVQFANPGHYSFVLSIDMVEINRLEFKVHGPHGLTINAE